MEQHGVKGTVALNSDVCANYPRIIEAGNSARLGMDGPRHQQLDPDQRADRGRGARADRRAWSRPSRRAPASAPRGWLGPALSETVHTLDILAENGIEYVGDWVNDEQPYPMRVKSGLDALDALFDRAQRHPGLPRPDQSPERFGQMICDQFDVLYEDGAKTGRVMSICLHPFLIGHPHRSKYFAKALAHISSRQRGLGHDRRRDRRLVQANLSAAIVGWLGRNRLVTNDGAVFEGQRLGTRGRAARSGSASAGALRRRGAGAGRAGPGRSSPRTTS